MPFLRHGLGFDGVDATQDDEPVGHGMVGRKVNVGGRKRTPKAASITITTSLQSDTPEGWAQYHRDLAAYHRSKGDHATAKKHDAVVAKWEKRAAVAAKKGTWRR
jgi:prephenate dehydrogenase